MSIAFFLDGIVVAKPSKRIKSNGATQKILPTHCFKKLTILQSTVEASDNFPSQIPYSIEVTYNLLAHYIWPPRLLNGGHNWTEYDPITQHPSYWSHMQTCCDYIATSTWQFFVNFLLSFIVCYTAWTITKIQNCETEISDGRCTAANSDSNLCPISSLSWMMCSLNFNIEQHFVRQTFANFTTFLMDIHRRGQVKTRCRFPYLAA